MIYCSRKETRQGTYIEKEDQFNFLCFFVLFDSDFTKEQCLACVGIKFMPVVLN